MRYFLKNTNPGRYFSLCKDSSSQGGPVHRDKRWQMRVLHRLEQRRAPAVKL